MKHDLAITNQYTSETDELAKSKFHVFILDRV